MYFTDVEKRLVQKSLDALKEQFENKRSVFEIGTPARERLENKLEAIHHLKNNLDKDDFTRMEKEVLFDAFNGLRDTLVGNRTLFDVGSVEREQLESNLGRLADMINNIMKSHYITPEVGRIYTLRGGGDYECLSVTDADRVKQGECSAVFLRVSDGWKSTVHGLQKSDNGTVEWDYSTGGHWVKDNDPKPSLAERIAQAEQQANTASSNIPSKAKNIEQEL